MINQDIANAVLCIISRKMRKEKKRKEAQNFNFQNFIYLRAL
jgi:hypothetical protein